MTPRTPVHNGVSCQALEEAARRYPLHAVRLTGRTQTPIGLLLVEEGTSGRELETALAALNLGARHFSTAAGPGPAFPAAESALPDRAWLRSQLEVELDRVTRTRLPCALLLVSLRGKKNSGSLLAQAATLLEPCLHQVDLLGRAHTNSLGLILPGTNVGKARKRAEEIRNSLRAASFTEAGKKLRPTLAMGIAVCHAYEKISAGQLLANAEDELARAAKIGDEAICHAAPSRPEDSCQVTVEERAQLFSFLQKETWS